MRLLRNKFAVVWLFGLVLVVPFWTFTWLTGGENSVGNLNRLVFDTYQRSKPRSWSGSDIVVVDIDEESISHFGQWPWPRSVLAQLTDRLGELGAAAIVFDMVFSEPDRTSPIRAIKALEAVGATISLPSGIKQLDNDEMLANSFAKNPVISGIILSNQGRTTAPLPKAGTGFSGTPPPGLMQENVKAVVNLPQLDQAATGTGNFGLSAQNQSDAVIRKVDLLRPINGSYYPSLAMETLRVVQGAGSFKLKSSDGSGEFSGGELSLVSTQVGALEIPVGPKGELTIYHSPSRQKSVVPAAAVVVPQVYGWSSEKLSNEIANHIVLVGTSAEGLLDLRATPLESVVPGVFIHADILDQIVAGTFLSRPDIAPGLELLAGIVAVLAILAIFPFLNPLANGFLSLSVAGGIIVGFWLAFSQSLLLLSPLTPLISIALAYAGAMAATLLVTERQGRFVREAFTHYLSPAMVERLANNPETLKLGGEEKELTVLFCDIRSFTSLSEGLDPTQLTDLLNNFLTPMTTELLERGATIDKYMGDAIMAFWNAPIDQPDHAQRACEGALAMREALKQLTANSNREIAIGIGLNSGPCCVGNLGSNQRFNYSAIGDSVNVASRIEGLTKFYGVDNLVADETVKQISGLLCLEIDSVAVVGREQALTVHTIITKENPQNLKVYEQLSQHHQTMLDAYRLGDVEEALVAMTKASRMAANIEGLELKKLYALYAERLATFRDQGVPENWDGIFHASQK